MGKKRWLRKGKVSVLKKKRPVYHFSPALCPQNMSCLTENSVSLANKSGSLENLISWEAPSLALAKCTLTLCRVNCHWSAGYRKSHRWLQRDRWTRQTERTETFPDNKAATVVLQISINLINQSKIDHCLLLSCVYNANHQHTSIHSESLRV